MHKPNIHEVRENLAEYLVAAQRGEEVLICRRNRPVARLVALPLSTPRGERPIGQAADAGTPLPSSFWDELPEEFADALAGHGGADAPGSR
ncbi:MAG: type II toxin-antitoxin system prevent-host-death family antitoxin [Rubrivivax sp.]